MPERSNGTVLKTVEGLRPPWVRIPPSPYLLQSYCKPTATSTVLIANYCKDNFKLQTKLKSSLSFNLKKRTDQILRICTTMIQNLQKFCISTIQNRKIKQI